MTKPSASSGNPCKLALAVTPFLLTTGAGDAEPLGAYPADAEGRSWHLPFCAYTLLEGKRHMIESERQNYLDLLSDGCTDPAARAALENDVTACLDVPTP